MRNRALLALSLPLAAAGCLAGHAAGYGLAGASRRDTALHGYLAYTPLFLAACLSLVLIALGLRLSGRLPGRLAAWPFASLPPLAFSLQELLERLAAGLSPHTVLHPVVLAGLAAQLPLAALAFLLARALLRGTDVLARALAGPPAVALRFAALGAPASAAALLSGRLSFDRLGRAPPRH